MSKEIDSDNYALIIASFLWWKIDPKDHGWAKQSVFPMWVSEAISRITAYHSGLNLGTHICIHAIAQGHQEPYAENIINKLVKNTKAEKDFEYAYKK